MRRAVAPRSTDALPLVRLIQARGLREARCESGTSLPRSEPASPPDWCANRAALRSAGTSGPWRVNLHAYCRSSGIVGL
jgi:hypothetical protein